MKSARLLRKSFSLVLTALVLFSSVKDSYAESGGRCESAHAVSRSVVEVDPKLLATIANLPEHEQIPRAVFEQYKVNDIARAIVTRIQKQEAEHAELFKPGYYGPVDFKNETEIVLFFDIKNLKSIQEKGFLNQHLTKSSRGVLDPARRRKIEDEYTGLGLGIFEISKILRPKSAFLNVHSPSVLDKKIMDPVIYGSVGAVLKNSVRDRATWTSGDSLNQHKGPQSISDRMKNRGTFERGSLPKFAGDSLYYEAQIYGEIDVNDVDYFLVKDLTLALRLKELNKPVYRAEVEQSYERIIYSKKELLFAGEPVRLAPAPEISAPAKAEIIESPKISVSPEAETFARMLKISGIDQEIRTVKRGALLRDEFELSHITTTADEYSIYTPREAAETSFEDYTSELRRSLDVLQAHGFETMKIMHLTDSFVVQKGPGTYQELPALSALERRAVLVPLKKLITKLIENKIYVKGLRPSMLLLGDDGQLVIRANDGVREMKSAAKTVERFDEKLLQHWDRYFDDLYMKQLEDHLKQLRVTYPKEKAS